MGRRLVRMVLFLLLCSAAVRAARCWFPVRVAGGSMEPTLREGEVLAVRPLRPGEPLLGQIVVAQLGEREVIKRVGVPPEPVSGDAIWLIGDDASRSTDSRTTGPVPRDAIRGVARACYWPPTRVRLIPG